MLSTTGGSGGVLDVFYEDWKLKVNEHPKVVSHICALFESTYAMNVEPFSHPYGAFEPYQPYMYIDRVCFRVPESVSRKFSHRRKGLQRSLAPHLDCCPHKLYESEKQTPKWRPIQAFVALSDTTIVNEGGFECHPGFHLKFKDWAQNRRNGFSRGEQSHIPPPCVGEFTPIRPVEDREVIQGMVPISCRAGDMVCWDYRIPHANSRRNDSDRPREAIYVGVLPGTAMNKRYAADQLERYRQGIVPSDQWHDHLGRQASTYPFSELGERMMGMQEYRKSDALDLQSALRM
jgi:hypothetical protein